MAVNNSLTKTNNQRMGISAFMTSEAVQKQINSVVGGKNGTRFITSVVSAVNANPALQECTNQSILSAALLGEALNLSPSAQLGFFYMVPYDNKGTKVAQFQMGYKGYIQLAIRSGQYKKLNVMPIKEGELIHFDALNEEIEVNLIEDEELREKAKTTGYYACFEYINGFRKAMYWSKEKMESHALKYSSGYRSDKNKKTAYTFWTKDFDSMACKTLLRQLISKWGVMSTEFETAYENDMAAIDEKGNATYVDNPEIIDTTAAVVEDPNPTTETTPEAEKNGSNDAAKALFG